MTSTRPYKIFVGGLSLDTKEDNLRTYFSQYGEVTGCIIKYDSNTALSRGFGFVSFSEFDVLKSILSTNHTIKGKQVDCKEAMTKEEAFQLNLDLLNSKKKIFVGKIPRNLKKNDLVRHFTQYGEIEDVNLIFKKPKEGFAFIVFDTNETAEKAQNEKNHVINENKIECKLALPRKDLTLQHNQFNYQQHQNTHTNNRMGLMGNLKQDLMNNGNKRNNNTMFKNNNNSNMNNHKPMNMNGNNGNNFNLKNRNNNHNQSFKGFDPNFFNNYCRQVQQNQFSLINNNNSNNFNLSNNNMFQPNGNSNLTTADLKNQYNQSNNRQKNNNNSSNFQQNSRNYNQNLNKQGQKNNYQQNYLSSNNSKSTYNNTKLNGDSNNNSSSHSNFNIDSFNKSNGLTNSLLRGNVDDLNKYYTNQWLAPCLLPENGNNSNSFNGFNINNLYANKLLLNNNDLSSMNKMSNIRNFFQQNQQNESNISNGMSTKNSNSDSKNGENSNNKMNNGSASNTNENANFNMLNLINKFSGMSLNNPMNQFNFLNGSTNNSNSNSINSNNDLLKSANLNMMTQKLFGLDNESYSELETKDSLNFNMGQLSSLQSSDERIKGNHEKKISSNNGSQLNGYDDDNNNSLNSSTNLATFVNARENMVVCQACDSDCLGNDKGKKWCSHSRDHRESRRERRQTPEIVNIIQEQLLADEN